MDAPVVEHDNDFCTTRVTCRDWFQLTLKEGLTVYRDQLFSADLGSAAVKRIEDVRALRAAQFPEDAGPTAHPIRPDSYIAMDNFYTAVRIPSLDIDGACVFGLLPPDVVTLYPRPVPVSRLSTRKERRLSGCTRHCSEKTAFEKGWTCISPDMMARL